MFPLNYSQNGLLTDQFIVLLHQILIPLWLFFFGYFIWVLFKKNKNLYLLKLLFLVEIGLLITELGLLLFKSIPGFAVLTKTDLDAAFEVKVVAEQYAWNFHYPGKDGRFGACRAELISVDNPVGLDRSDPNAKDDVVTINQLYLPIQQKISFVLLSKDVIHNFFVPALRIKQDIIPGEKGFATTFITREGEDLEVACAQLCGLGHYRMRGFAFFVSLEKFEAWYAARLSEEL